MPFVGTRTKHVRFIYLPATTSRPAPGHTTKVHEDGCPSLTSTCDGMVGEVRSQTHIHPMPPSMLPCISIMCHNICWTRLATAMLVSCLCIAVVQYNSAACHTTRSFTQIPAHDLCNLRASREVHAWTLHLGHLPCVLLLCMQQPQHYS